jgi:hypothetical protein
MKQLTDKIFMNKKFNSIYTVAKFTTSFGLFSDSYFYFSYDSQRF